MNEVISTETNVDVVKPSETKKTKKQFLMLNSKTRFYGFRNTERLKALKRFIGLFIATSILGLLVFIAGIVIFVVWLVILIVTFGLIHSYTDNWFYVIENCFMLGGLIFIASIVLRVIIEFLYVRLERFELRRNSDGAKKYLAVMNASAIIRLINLALGAVVVGLGIWAYSAGFGQNTETIIFVVAAIVAFIASRITLRKVYGKVTDEIIEIRKERNAGKYQAS